jgi:hypothetical protein
MLVVQATKKLLVWVGPTSPGAGEEATGLLGSWHATRCSGAPRSLSSSTTEPCFQSSPRWPRGTLLRRFPDALGHVLAAYHVPGAVIAAELDHMREHRLGY